MFKQIYEIDENGFIHEIYVGEFDTSGNLLNPMGDFITTDLPQPLPYYKPKWNGTQWIEGATQEEIAEMIKPLPIVLTPLEQALEDVINRLVATESALFDIILGE